MLTMNQGNILDLVGKVNWPKQKKVFRFLPQYLQGVKHLSVSATNVAVKKWPKQKAAVDIEQLIKFHKLLNDIAHVDGKNF